MATADQKTNDQQQSKNKTTVIRGILLAVVVGFGVNIILAFSSNGEELLASIAEVKWYHFLVPFAINGLLLAFIEMIRLKLVTSQFQYKIRWRDAFANSSLGHFFNNLTPMAAGGQGFQIYHLQSLGVNGKTATNIILSRFVVNAMILFILIFLGIPQIIEISKNAGMGGIFFYSGLIVTFIFAILFLIILINPLAIGKLAHKIRHTGLGKFISRVSKKPRWALELFQWTHGLRKEIRYLWSQKTSVMIADIFLNIIFQLAVSFSIWYSLVFVGGSSITFFETVIAFNIIWQVVFYIPTPGASGTLEISFASVFAGFTGNYPSAYVAIVVWRLASYYMQIGFGLLVFFADLRRKPTPANVLEDAKGGTDLK
jgi:uncharacterized protein (TIRG00374 family)